MMKGLRSLLIVVAATTLSVAVRPMGVANAAPTGPEAAAEKSKTVRYSYDAWSRAGKKRFVLVPRPTELKPGPLKDRVKDLFAQLVGDKRNTYGDARLAFNPDVETTGEVFVHLDPTKADYHAIVMAETVYTFTENGARRVRFPRVQEAGWTRAEVPQAAYALTLPLFETLPPDEVPGALAVLPDGSMLPTHVVTQRLRAGDKPLLEMMWGYVQSGPPQAAQAALAAALVLKPADLEARLLPVLDSANASLRGSSLDGLAGRDNPTVNKALRKVMDEDPDLSLRDRAAGMLSKSADPTFATAAQYHALKSKDPKIASVAAEALGASKQPEAGEQLLSVLSHLEATVRQAAIASLVKRGEEPGLAQRLRDGKIPEAARIEVAVALSRVSKADLAVTGLAYLAVQSKGEQAASAATELGRFESPATYDALGVAVNHAEAPVRIAAAGALAKLAQPRGLTLLSRARLDDPDSGPATAAAMRTIFAAQPTDFVLKSAKDKDPVVRRMAVATLGELIKRGPKGDRRALLDVLRGLAGDGKADIRAAAARSFEDAAGDDVRPDVMKLAADSSVEVKRAVAHALRAFPGKEAVKFLLGYVQETDPELLAHAIDSIGVLKEREGLDPVVTQLNHDDVRVRRAATGALERIGSTLPDDKRTPMLSFFSERLFDKDGEVRLRALDGLGLVKDKRVVSAMAALLQDPLPEVRKATLLAMARTADEAAVEAIASGLEDDDNEVRRAALDAFRKLKHKSAVPVLTAYAKKESDKGLAEEANKVIQAINKGG
jgi:HEAT repeat protein